MALQYIWDRKRARCYVYAYKGGPRIMVYEGLRRSPRFKPALDAAASAKLADALAKRESLDASKFRSIIRAWENSPEWLALEPGTRKTWSRHLVLIEEKWGDVPVGVWNDSRMTAKVVAWRNSRKDTPRTADIGVTVLVALLKWARLMGHGIAINVAADIPQLYKGAQREEIVWTEDDMQAFAEKAIELEREHIIDGLWLAALTGLRRADLVTLTFDHIGEFAVTKTALKKSKGRRRRATIPMTPALEALLAELRGRHRAEGVDTVLVNSFGRPWSGDGFGGSFNRVRDEADIKHVEEDGTERMKHLHDLRGTFCTMLLAECELTDREAADIMAWSPDRVAHIRKTYVDGARVVVAIGARIAGRSRAKHGAKQR